MRFSLPKLAFALLATACASTSAPRQTHANGYDVERTHLTVVVDREARAIAATQVTTIRVEHDLSVLVFDANALTLNEASIDGAAAMNHADASGIVVELPRRYRTGETLELRLSYHGRPARGLVFDEGAFYTSYSAAIGCTARSIAQATGSSSPLL